MNHPKTCHDQAFWFSHVENWQKTGLSQAEYCRRNSLNPLTFSRFKISKVGRDLSSVNVKANPKIELVAVPISGHPNQEVDFFDSGFSINIGKSAQIKINRYFDRSCLNQILRSLSEL